jgi:hypothetical protein
MSKLRPWVDVQKMRKDMRDNFFVQHATTMAFAINSTQWPTHWRAVIFKLEKRASQGFDDPQFVVWPRNPEYDIYMDKVDQAGQGMSLDTMLADVPPMHLDPVVFESIKDIDQWATTVSRMTR